MSFAIRDIRDHASLLDSLRRAEMLGHSHFACEVNVRPPNPTSDAFHASFGFTEIGTATIDDSAKTVRYLLRRQRAPVASKR
jgi:predicted GNAT superfamily acetyltransferase